MSTARDQGESGDGSIEPSDWLRSIAGALGPGSARASAWIASGTIVDGGYRVERALAAGGMAVVYLARDLELDRRVALKLYDIDARELSLSRIYREARAMAQLSHPNVLVVHGVGVHAQRVFLAMEYVEGETLRGWLAHARPGWRQILATFVACARGLAAAHAVGLAHGDFKPDNVLIGHDGRPRVADFGLARTIGSSWEHDVEASSAPMRAAVTERFVGTRGYAAPEILHGAPADERGDQFAFCVALHEALYGVHPFEGDDIDAQVEALRVGRLRARPSGNVPARIHHAIVRGLAADPTQRFVSLDALIAALEHDAWRRRSRVIAATALVGTAALVGLAWPRAATCDLAAAALDESWTPARADALWESFAATGSPIASSAHAATTLRLDRWADAWRAERQDSCAATHVRGEQSDAILDRRMLCLDRQRARLESTLAVLEDADREVVTRAEDLIVALPEPSSCADVDRLLAQVPAPDDPALARAVEDERRELDDARVATDIGRYDEAKTRALAVHDGATASAYAPLHAEAALVLGIARWRAFDNDAAEASLTEAYHEASALGDDETAAIASRELVCNLIQVASSTERAEWWSRVAETTGTRSGERVEDRLQRLACDGASLFAAGRYAESEAVLRSAIVEADALPDSMAAPQLHDRLGSTLYALDHNAEAAAEHGRAIEQATALRGSSHPMVLNARSNLAQDLLRLDRAGEALAMDVDVLQSAIALLGPDHPLLINPYNKLALALEGLGALPQAIAYRGRGIAIARARGDQARSLVVLLGNQADDLLVAGRGDDGLAMMAEALAVAEVAAGPMHVDTGRARINYGSWLFASDRLDEAETELRRGLEILEPALGDEHPTLGIVHGNLAQVALWRNDADTAARELEVAERIATAAHDTRLTIFVTLTRADARRLAHDIAGARELQERAVALVEGVDPLHERVAVFQLGSDNEALGDFAAALECFTRARELSEAQGNATRLSESELAMAQVAWPLGRRADARRWAKAALAGFVARGEQDGERRTRTWIAAHR
jgi:tetratricopeptide (TPR) repeat protein